MNKWKSDFIKLMGFPCFRQPANVLPLNSTLVLRAAVEKGSSFCVHHLLKSGLCFYKEGTHLLNMIL